MKKFLTRNILLLSFVSFFTDIASEIIYPILPLYFASIGLSYAAVGAIEGLAQLVAGLSKVFFGLISDKLGKKVIFLNIGYGISAVAKPLLVLSQSLPYIILLRVTDRFSKGIRTAPRDAILISESPEEHRGKVFSFHRSLDTLGAAIGPIIALILLVVSNNNYSQLFALTIIPGIIAVILTFLIKIKESVPKDVDNKEVKKRISFFNFLKKAPAKYKKILIGLILISLINTTDFFFLLRAREILNLNNSFGIPIPSEFLVIILYIIYNLSFVIVANPIGAISDRIGHKKSIIFALFIFSLVYGLLAYELTLPFLILSFVLWGVFATIYDSIGKAWLSLYIPKEYKATGIGLLVTLTSIATFAGNIIVGLIIDRFNTSIAFSIVSVISIFVIGYFLLIKSLDKND